MSYELRSPRITRGRTEDGPTAILEQDFVLPDESEGSIATLRVRMTDGSDEYVIKFGRMIMHERLKNLVDQTAAWADFTLEDLDEIPPAE